MKGECNSKMGKQSFTVLDTAEPHLILCKDMKIMWADGNTGVFLFH